MIKTRRLKNVAIFIQTILSFLLSRKITFSQLTKNGGRYQKMFRVKGVP